jgi:3-oxoadipate enol-lactonase
MALVSGRDDERMTLRDGVGLAFERHGSGPLMVWGHGLTSSRANEDGRGLWHLAVDVPAAGFELVRWDARGHGRSGGTTEPATYGWASLAADAAELLTALGAGPAVVGGASMGAATALHLAVQRPELVRALVLVIPPTAWGTRPAQRTLYEQSAGFVRARGREAWVAATQALPPIPILAGHPELWGTGPDIEEVLLPWVLEGAAGSDLPPMEVLTTVRVPALVLAWDTDPGHPVSTAEALGAALPDATVHVATTVGEIRAFGARIRSFLVGLP